MCAVLWGNFKQKKAQEKADLITISPERQGDTATHHENTTEVIVNCRVWKKRYNIEIIKPNNLLRVFSLSSVNVSLKMSKNKCAVLNLK